MPQNLRWYPPAQLHLYPLAILPTLPPQPFPSSGNHHSILSLFQILSSASTLASSISEVCGCVASQVPCTSRVSIRQFVNTAGPQPNSGGNECLHFPALLPIGQAWVKRTPSHQTRGQKTSGLLGKGSSPDRPDVTLPLAGEGSSPCI